VSRGSRRVTPATSGADLRARKSSSRLGRYRTRAGCPSGAGRRVLPRGRARSDLHHPHRSRPHVDRPGAPRRDRGVRRSGNAGHVDGLVRPAGARAARRLTPDGTLASARHHPIDGIPPTSGAGHASATRHLAVTAQGHRCATAAAHRRSSDLACTLQFRTQALATGWSPPLAVAGRNTSLEGGGRNEAHIRAIRSIPRSVVHDPASRECRVRRKPGSQGRCRHTGCN
jgi:hypothetical protein